MHDALTTIASITENNQEVARQLLNGNLQSQHWMQTIIQELTLEGRSALRDVAEPVGKSVRTISYGEQPQALTIDEPVVSPFVHMGKLRWEIARRIVSNLKEYLRLAARVGSG